MTAIIVLCSIAIAAALVLYFCSKKFAVEEDSRIGLVSQQLPGANCGGCGYAGCSGMASAIVKAADEGSIEGFNCPAGGSQTMKAVASLLGFDATEGEENIAIVRCNGSCDLRPQTNQYDGLKTCSATNACGMGQSLCGYGCLGCGDCVAVCKFNAISISSESGLAFVNHDLCTGCGACVKECPRNIIELRLKKPKNRMIYVSCMNQDKGAVAMKACKAACIGCGKCSKECKFEAISISNNLSYIDGNKCRLCRKCESVCPTKAIIASNFPPRKNETLE